MYSNFQTDKWHVPEDRGGELGHSLDCLLFAAVRGSLIFWRHAKRGGRGRHLLLGLLFAAAAAAALTLACTHKHTQVVQNKLQQVPNHNDSFPSRCYRHVCPQPTNRMHMNLQPGSVHSLLHLLLLARLPVHVRYKGTPHMLSSPNTSLSMAGFHTRQVWAGNLALFLLNGVGQSEIGITHTHLAAIHAGRPAASERAAGCGLASSSTFPWAAAAAALRATPAGTEGPVYVWGMCLYMCIYVCMHLYMCVCVCVCVYVCMRLHRFSGERGQARPFAQADNTRSSI